MKIYEEGVNDRVLYVANRSYINFIRLLSKSSLEERKHVKDEWLDYMADKGVITPEQLAEVSEFVLPSVHGSFTKLSLEDFKGDFIQKVIGLYQKLCAIRSLVLGRSKFVVCRVGSTVFDISLIGDWRALLHDLPRLLVSYLENKGEVEVEVFTLHMDFMMLKNKIGHSEFERVISTLSQALTLVKRGILNLGVDGRYADALIYEQVYLNSMLSWTYPKRTKRDKLSRSLENYSREGLIQRVPVAVAQDGLLKIETVKISSGVSWLLYCTVVNLCQVFSALFIGDLTNSGDLDCVFSTSVSSSRIVSVNLKHYKRNTLAMIESFLRLKTKALNNSDYDFEFTISAQSK